MRPALFTALLVLAISGSAAGSPTSLPPLPARWPATLQIGMADDPGDASVLRKAAPFGFRYAYLAGGVNTGGGWTTWNPGGTFVTRYVDESWAAGEIPVFSYYMLLQSKPTGGDERTVDISHLHDPALMRQYWAQVRLFFERAHGSRTVVLHVEPDLWGYLEQAGDVALASQFAQEFVSLRNELAPNVLLAYHMSGWGTKHDIQYEKPPSSVVVRYATESARFYEELHAKFDVAFEDFSDRDAAFYAVKEHNPSTWMKPPDFARQILYAATFVRLTGLRMVGWQIPLGNTVMRAENNTWDHYQDNRVQWLLGPDSRAHLRAYVAAGYVGFLFGRGADGNTCACDAAHDGVTNPPPIDRNTRLSLSADDDGGYFKAQAAAYYRAGAIRLAR
jgi:hypothetical protein